MNETQTYELTGVDCADCARVIEINLRQMPGVQAANLNVTTATLRVEGGVPRPQIIQRLQDLGYGVRPQGAAASAPDRRGFLGFLLGRRDTTLALLGAMLVLPGLLFHELLPLPALQLPVFNLTSLLAMLAAGFPVARRAWVSLRASREVTMNLLMTLAGLGAVAIGAYHEAGVVMVLFAVGEALEGYTMQKAGDSIRSLMQAAPDEALVLRPCIDCRSHLGRDGYTGGECPFCGLEEMRVALADVRPGETVVVRPGERIPMDGVVLSGSSAVNQAPITGESLPVDKAPGDEVLAGCVNGPGALEVRASGRADDNLIARIVRRVAEAQEQRAPVQRFVDRFAKIYTPAVVGVAALVAALPPLLFGAPFLNPPGGQGWLYRSLELLVIACPCALVISTPVSLVSAISRAARGGVLFKSGAAVESLARVKAVAFDKTGTLTSGRPSLQAAHAADCRDPLGTCAPCEDLLALASAVERRSDHPLARAVVEAARERSLLERYPAAEAVTAFAGQGLSGRVNGQEVFIGSHARFDDRVAHDLHCAEIGRLSADGQTPVLVSAGGEYRGYMLLADTLRPYAASAVDELKRLGVERLVMLSGDHPAAAQSVARRAGLSEAHGGLLPEDKLEAVRSLRREMPTAMLGDGINDAPALAGADVGIAMGAAGSAQAMETADVALMDDDLRRLPFALRLSRAAMRTIRQNVALSLGLKAAFLALILAGWGSMWAAVAADMGASLLVTLNGMRLLRWKA